MEINMLADGAVDIANLLVVAGVVLLIVGVAWFIIYSAVRSAMKPDAPKQPLAEPTRGIFEIRGIYRTTKAKATWRTKAASEKDAQAKAEQKGIDVREISRI